jgi:hypothetical protein
LREQNSGTNERMKKREERWRAERKEKLRQYWSEMRMVDKKFKTNKRKVVPVNAMKLRR